MEAIKQKISQFPFRRTTTQIINLGVLISSAMILWKIWVCLGGTVSPLTVVLSGSMEPGFQRGDALLLHYNDAPIRAGEIVVFTVEGHQISIVHRVIKVHQQRNATDVKYILTKGDNNEADDSWGIYADNQEWLEQKNVQGKVIGILRYAGWPTIIMNEYPLVKFDGHIDGLDSRPSVGRPLNYYNTEIIKQLKQRQALALHFKDRMTGYLRRMPYEFNPNDAAKLLETCGITTKILSIEIHTS